MRFSLKHTGIAPTLACVVRMLMCVPLQFDFSPLVPRLWERYPFSRKGNVTECCGAEIDEPTHELIWRRFQINSLLGMAHLRRVSNVYLKL